MSLLMALLSGGVSAWSPPAGGSGPPPGESTAVAAPTHSDSTLMAMRPTQPPIMSVVVAKDGSGDYTSLTDALTRLSNVQRATALSEGLTEVAPWHRVQALVKPGSYGAGETEIQLPPWCSVIATDPTRGATSVVPGIGIGNGVWWEGIDVTNVTTGYAPKYATHVYTSSSPSTTVMTRCTLANPSTSSGGGTTPVGMDGAARGTFVLHDVDLTTGASTNLHGLTGWGASDGMDVVFSKVRFPGGKLWYSALQNVSNDQVWVVDCQADSWQTIGTATTTHVARSTVTQPGTTNGASDTSASWPVPTGGMSARCRTYWGL